jgi:hypothetical protein
MAAKTPPTHIDIGGLALPRRELVEVLPDIDRFERCLTDALAVDIDMKQSSGAIPDYIGQWSKGYTEAVIRTLKEISSLRQQASELARHDTG